VDSEPSFGVSEGGLVRYIGPSVIVKRSEVPKQKRPFDAALVALDIAFCGLSVCGSQLQPGDMLHSDAT
jgi:hypothetical protein